MDAIVAALLAGWIAETPEAEGDALLQKAYLYVRDMTYSGGNHYNFGAVDCDAWYIIGKALTEAAEHT